MVSWFPFTPGGRNDSHLRKDKAQWVLFHLSKPYHFSEAGAREVGCVASSHLLCTRPCFCAGLCGHVLLIISTPNSEDSELHVPTSFRDSTQFLMARSRFSMCGLILWTSCLVILLYLSRGKKNPSQTVVIYYVLWPTMLTE